MNLTQKGKISSRQLAIMLFGFLSGSSIVSSTTLGAGHGVWMSIIIGYAEGLLLVLLFIKLTSRYPGQSLFEINTAVFGSWLGKLISLCYIWYFFHISTLVTRSFTDYFITTFYPETPLLVLAIIGPFLAAYAVIKGIETIARCSTFLAPFAYLVTLITIFLLIPQMNFANFLPIFDKPLKEILIAGQEIAILPYGESLVFLVLVPYLNKPTQLKSSFFIAFTVTLSIHLLLFARNVSILGPTIEIFLYPSYEAVRMINIANLITRGEVLVAGTLFFLDFIKTSILYHAILTGLENVFGLQSFRPLIFPLGVLITAVSLLQFENPLELLDFTGSYYPLYSLFFQLFLPLLTLTVSLFRQKKPAQEVR